MSLKSRETPGAEGAKDTPVPPTMPRSEDVRDAPLGLQPPRGPSSRRMRPRARMAMSWLPLSTRSPLRTTRTPRRTRLMRRRSRSPKRATGEEAEAPKRARRPRRRRAAATANDEPEAATAEDEPEAAEEEPEAEEEPVAPAPTRRRSRRDPNEPAPVVRAQAKYVRSSARKARPGLRPHPRQVRR